MAFKAYSETNPHLKDKHYPEPVLIDWEKSRHKIEFANYLYSKWRNELCGTNSDTGLSQRYEYDSAICKVASSLAEKYIRNSKDFLINYTSIESYDVPASASNIHTECYADELKWLVFLPDFYFYEVLSHLLNLIDDSKFTESIEYLLKELGINMMICNDQFVPRQSKEITEKIYKPTFELLQGFDFLEVNKELDDAFASYLSKDFGKVISHSINAIHALLQIVVDGEFNQKKKISQLLKEIKKDKLLSDYELTHNLYNNLNSYLEQVRKAKTSAHPTKKEEKATTEDALFVLNLTMVILQNIIASKNVKEANG